MQVRPVTNTPRKRHHAARRALLAILRWTFIAIGAVTAAAVLFTHLFHVNKSIYDPSMFAIGVGGLFCLLCGIMLMVLSRNSRLALELRRAKIRCEELADHTWELKEAEARATSLLEAQGDLIVRRDSQGRIKRSLEAKHEFKNTHPCPATGKSFGRCPGYVIDHVIALKRGGPDKPSNMQWQTIKAAKEKDKTE
jgi:hypothetical protein